MNPTPTHRELEETLKALARIADVLDRAGLEASSLDDKANLYRGRNDVRDARAKIRPLVYVYEDAVKSLGLRCENSRDWYCCEADYPDHAPDCPNSVENNP